MIRNALLLAAPLLLASAGPAAAAKYTVKVEDAPPPAEIGNRVRSLLDVKGLSVYDDGGNLLLTVWPRKAFESKATAEQVKNGLTYRELEESDVVGAVKFPKLWTDFRKQKIKAGVYTIRVGWQPMDGDHMGTAPYGEFCLACPASDDTKPDLMESKSLNELSAKTTESHPGVFLLFPGKGAAAEPKLVNKGMGHWVLLVQLGATAGGKKAALDLGLTLVGTSAAA